MDFTIFSKKGFYFAVAITLLASFLGSYLAKLPYLSVIGALVIALLFGMLFQLIPNLKQHCEPGTGFISNKFLRLGIILLGFKLNLIALAQAGVKTIVLAALVVTSMIVLCYLICSIAKVEKTLALLASCGCGICGAAAVMGVSPQLKAKADDAVLAVAVVAILGTVFTVIEVLIFPYLGLNAHQFGLAAGASLHEIAHAVAAGGAGGPEALDTAIITKLSRVLMLIPVAILVGLFAHRGQAQEQENKGKLPIPYFMLGFLAASCIGTYLPLGATLLSALVSLAYIFLGMAMAALGMSVNFNVIAKRGARVFIACFIASCILLIAAVLAAKLFF